MTYTFQYDSFIYSSKGKCYWLIFVIIAYHCTDITSLERKVAEDNNKKTLLHFKNCLNQYFIIQSDLKIVIMYLKYFKFDAKTLHIN